MAAQRGDVVDQWGDLVAGGSTGRSSGSLRCGGTMGRCGGSIGRCGGSMEELQAAGEAVAVYFSIFLYFWGSQPRVDISTT